jgi:putative flippase GtrA
MNIKEQFIKFFLVGLLNTFIDFSVFNFFALFFELTTLNYIFLKAGSFLVAATNSFTFNKNWVFKKKNLKNKKKTFLKFLSISGTGLIINIITSSLTFRFLQPTLSPFLAANTGILVGVSSVIAWDFLGYKFLVFKK